MKKSLNGLASFLLLFATIFSFANATYAASDSDQDKNPVMSTIGQAYVVSAADQGSENDYVMIVDGALKAYHTDNKSFDAQPNTFVSFKAKGDRIVDFIGTVNVPSTTEKIMAKDTAKKTLDLEQSGRVKLASDYTVFLLDKGQATASSLSQVYVGASNVSVYYNETGQAFLLLLNGKTPVSTIRVGIMDAGFLTTDHKQIAVQSAGGFTIQDKKAGQSVSVDPNTVVTFTSQADGTTQATAGGNVLYQSANRLYAVPARSDALLQIMSFKRAYGYPLYRGVFEITPSATSGMLNLINEVPLEQYLYQVVPSEMPASFGLEALKAQSVAARTYALADWYANRFAAQGFHVLDSTLSQVYNNSAENALTAQAVNETNGLIMQSHDGALVDARYYSTSGGYGAARQDVWSDPGTNQFPGTPVPYLTAHSYTYDPADSSHMLQLNTQDEAAINQFYKNLSYTGYDSESYYFRWKVSFSASELQNTINKNLIDRYKADPNFILTKMADGQWVSKAIPSNGVGTIQNLYVAKRGAGGNMTELVIEGTTGTYKIVKEYNIRFTVRPSKAYTGGADVNLYRAKGGQTSYDLNYTLKNYTILPSAFATFDIAKDASGNLSSVTFYGGGNGHGVGMSQYGASALGAKGWTYDQILNAYYAGMELVDVYGG